MSAQASVTTPPGPNAPTNVAAVFMQPSLRLHVQWSVAAACGVTECEATGYAACPCEAAQPSQASATGASSRVSSDRPSSAPSGAVLRSRP